MADESVREVLQELHMHALINRFIEEKVDLKTLISCSDEELSRLGVTTIGDRIRLKDCCRKKSRTSLRPLRRTPAVNSTSSSSATSSFAGAISSERSILFHPYNTSSSNINNRKKGKSGTKRSGTKKKVDKYWTIQFLCLADTSSSRVPSTFEKQQLFKAGLGLRRIQLNLEDSEAEVIEKLSSDELSDERDPTSFVGFPQLKECGGFELMQCLPYSRDLAVVDSNLGAKLLKSKLGGSQGKVYIRPIQRSLSKKPICEDIFSERKEECLHCQKEFPVRDLRKHLWSHRCLAATNTMLYGDSSDSDSSAGSDILTKSPFVSAVEKDNIGNSEDNMMSPLIPPIQSEIPEEEEEEERGTMENPDPPAELMTVIEEITNHVKDIGSIVDQTLTTCHKDGLESNPVEILRSLQKNLVCGRSLEIEDPNICPEGATNFIMIDRLNIIRTGFEEIKGLENLFTTLEVQFYGEVAEDYGGPRKEFFRVILRAIKDDFFDNGLQAQEDKYVTIGKIFGLSLLQNGPLVQFLTEDMLDKIFTREHPSSPALRGLQIGLEALGIYQITVALPIFRHLFRPSNVKLTLKRLTSLLDPQFSESGSNARKFENDVYTQYLKYLREAASGRRGYVTLGHVLRFATGTDEEPILGFMIRPEVKFVEPEKGFLPYARTCINALMMPRATVTNPLPSSEQLFSFYDYAFNNSYFGNA